MVSRKLSFLLMRLRLKKSSGTVSLLDAGRIVHKSPEVVAQDFFLYRRNQFRFSHSAIFHMSKVTAAWSKLTGCATLRPATGRVCCEKGSRGIRPILTPYSVTLFHTSEIAGVLWSAPIHRNSKKQTPRKARCATTSAGPFLS